MDFNSPPPAITVTKGTGRPKKVKTPWSGKWDYKLEKYVGTGKYAGQDKPADHSPAWWKSKVISGDRYLKAYAKATYNQDLQKTFWFADKEQIKAAKEMVDEWCDINDYERLKKLPSRKATVSEATQNDLFGKVLFRKKATS